MLYGSWAADDSGADIILNGVLQHGIVTSLTYGRQNYDQLTPFDYYYHDAKGNLQEEVNAPIQAGFLPGINTLTFRVDNLSGSTGFRDELVLLADPLGLGTVGASPPSTANSVDEPASLGLLASGLAVIGLVQLRRRFTPRGEYKRYSS